MLNNDEAEPRKGSEACALRGNCDFSIEAIASKWNEIINSYVFNFK